MLADRVRMRVNIIKGQSPLMNISTNASAYASSIYQVYTPDLAIDGDISSPSSRWLSTREDSNIWWIVDFGYPCIINSIELYAESVAMNLFSYENELGQWVNINSVGNFPNYRLLEFDDIETQKVRLSFPGAVGIQRVFEVNVYGYMDNKDIEWGDYFNVTQNAKATASSQFGAARGPEKAITGVNNSLGSRWVSELNDSSAWLEVELLQEVRANKLVIYSSGDAESDNNQNSGFYNVLAYINKEWKNIARVDDNNLNKKEIPLSNIQSNKFKIVFDEVGPGGHHRVNEFEIYGSIPLRR